MLTSIRDRAQGLIAWVIVILITVPFALWGINTYFENSGKVVVAEVDGDDIPYDAYRNRYDDERRQMQQYLGKRFDQSMVDSLDFKRGVVERMVTEQLLTQDTVDRGYRISDAQLNEFIRSRREFQQDGKFSPELYEQVRRAYSRRGAAAFESEMRRSNMIQQVANGFSESAFVTGVERNRLLALVLQTRKFDYAVLTPDRFMQKVEVSPEEIEKYYKANAERYRQPDQVRVAYLKLTLDDVARDFDASEEELRAAYNDNIDRYKVEQRHARHVLLAVPAGASPEEEKKIAAQAADLAREARAGKDFAELARKYSADTATRDKGGDLGYVARGGADPAFERALFALAPGAISDPVRSSFGYHVIQLVDVRRQLDKSFDSVRKDLDREVRRRKAADRFHDLSVRLANLAYEHPENLDAAATDLGLKVQESGWFTRKGGEGIASNPKVVQAAFSDDVLTDGHNSELIELENDAVVTVRKLEYRESVVQPLEEVRATVEKALRTQKATARAVADGTELLARLNAGGNFAELTAAAQVAVQSAGPMQRSGAADVDPNIVAAAFSADRPPADGASYAGLPLGAGGYAIVRLTQVTDGDPAAADKAVRFRVEGLLRDREGSQYFDAMQIGLRKAAKIKVFADKL